MNAQIVTVVGGSGFVGRHVVKALCNAGYVVNVLCRDTIAAAHLKTAGNVGQVVLQHADITRPETLAGKMAGSVAVVNLVSTLYSRGRQSFEALNVRGAKAVAEEAARVGASRLIHISALGVERSGDTRYGATKRAGEHEVKHTFPLATILQPSLIFGHGDGFFDRFSRMSLLAPALPLVGGGSTLFQPVYVEDVAQAVVAALKQPHTIGHTYALAGPRSYSFKQLLQMMMATTGRKRSLLPLPTSFASVMGFVCELLPFPPAITRDQVKMLKHDNVRVQGEQGFESLGMEPRALEPLLPEILARYVK